MAEEQGRWAVRAAGQRFEECQFDLVRPDCSLYAGFLGGLCGPVDEEGAVSLIGVGPPPGRGGLRPRIAAEVPGGHLVKDEVSGRHCASLGEVELLGGERRPEPRNPSAAPVGGKKAVGLRGWVTVPDGGPCGDEELTVCVLMFGESVQSLVQPGCPCPESPGEGVVEQLEGVLLSPVLVAQVEHLLTGHRGPAPTSELPGH